MQVPSTSASAATVRRKSSRRSQMLKWLRRIHGWVGLWGAALGLLFGVTGFLQNHRAVMRIETPAPIRSTVQLAVPDDAPHDARGFTTWLAGELHLPAGAHPRVSREPAQQVTWSDRAITQPEHWDIRFNAPHYSVAASYWRGANTVTVTRMDHHWLSILENLHKSTGVGVGWVLLADSIAGAMILLSLTGVILWTEFNRKRLFGAGIFCASVAAMIVLGANSLGS